MPKQRNDSAEMLASFGASSTERRTLNAKTLQWDEKTENQTLTLQYLGHKTVTSSTNGKEYETYIFRQPDGGIVTFPLGVSGAALETVTRGDVLEITYRGSKKLSGGRRFNQFDIDLIGHGDIE